MTQLAAVSPTARSILITGASSGIGYCVAHGLAKQGWQVIASARQPDDVSRLRDEGLEAVLLDVADDESIRSAVGATLARTGGKLDALFNNAGFGVPGAVEDLSREAMRYQFETNVFGTLALTNAVLPLMRAQGHGRVIINGSILGYAAMPYRGAYNASKFALEGLADTLRQELHGCDVHVSLIEPGPVTSRFRPNAQQQFLRWIRPEASFHKKSYAAMEARLNKRGPANPFTLPPEAVLAVVERILQSKRPAARYPVTIPAHAFWYLKKWLPQTWLDALLLKASGDEPGYAYGRRR